MDMAFNIVCQIPASRVKTERRQGEVMDLYPLSSQPYFGFFAPRHGGSASLNHRLNFHLTIA